MLTLLALILALRFTGAAARVFDSWVATAGGWVMCCMATWAAAGVAGVAFPIWPVLLLALMGAVLEQRTSDPTWMATGDVALLLVASVFAVPVPGSATLLALAGGLAVVWTVAEAWARLTPVLLRHTTVLVGLLAVLVLTLRFVGPSDPLAPVLAMAPHLSVSAPCEGTRVELEGGSVAWHHRPRGGGPFPGALVLHGAHPQGSRQPATCSLVRALLHGGFAVLAVDHPGYGDSPAPGPDAPVEVWDPLPTHLAGLRWLDGHPSVSEVELLAGHSMGGTDAVRLLAARPDIPRTFLFGAGLTDPSERDRYWHDRFHSDRGLEHRVPFERWLAIRDRYYSFRAAVEELPGDHGHVVFVHFGLEWDNIRASRDDAYESIPGSKEEWRMEDASHYFNTLNWNGLPAADTRVMRRLARVLRAPNLPVHGVRVPARRLGEAAPDD
jgi:pimeloyl-ACP methyl ester carboxylesterase